MYHFQVHFISQFHYLVPSVQVPQVRNYESFKFLCYFNIQFYFVAPGEIVPDTATTVAAGTAAPETEAPAATTAAPATEVTTAPTAAPATEGTAATTAAPATEGTAATTAAPATEVTSATTVAPETETTSATTVALETETTAATTVAPETKTTATTTVAPETEGTTAATTAPETEATTAAVASTVFTVIKSGDFNDVSVWASGQIPFGKCSIVIPTGFTLTFTGEILDIEVTTLTIAGSFIISSTAGFTFQYVINIIIEDGGTFEDQTSTHILYFFAGSLCTFYSKASFVGSATIIYQFTALPATNNLGSNFTLGASFTGAFTFGILFSGEIQFFSSVTFIVGISGSFSVGGTWLGGIAPTADICSLVGGCGLYIPSGCSLLTASLNGRLEINFIFITVAEGGTFELGELSWAGGFRFLFDFTFNIYGTLSFASSSGGSIYLPFGCVFNFFAEAHFQSSIQITLMTFDVKLGDVEGIFVINLSTSFVGPYYISISFNGQITLSSQRKYQKQVYFSKV